jgi:hypothetical protein
MIQYHLGATCFDSQQCHQLQTKYLPYFLSKMSINWTTATAIHHGTPACYGGLEIFNLETEQGVQHASLIISHLCKADEVGGMLHISMDHLQLQAGVSRPIMSQPGHTQCFMWTNAILLTLGTSLIGRIHTLLSRIQWHSSLRDNVIIS